MKLRMAALAFVLPLALMAAGEPAIFTADSDGKTLTLQVGERFDVTLPGNFTTGYSWEILQGLGGVVELAGKPSYRSDSKDKNRVGAGGTVTFHFKAAAAGTAELKLVYHQSWIRDEPPAKYFQLSVEVRE